jgi:hypothetical protein
MIRGKLLTKWTKQFHRFWLDQEHGGGDVGSEKTYK